MRFVITEVEKNRIRLLYEQSLLNKTVNLFTDREEKKVAKTITVKSLEKVGEEVFFKVGSPDKIKLKQDEEGSSIIQLYKKTNIPYKLEEQEFEIMYKIMCNIWKYDKGEVSPIYTSIKTGIDFSGYDESLRKSGYPLYYYNKKFVLAVYTQFCKTGAKPVSDFQP